LAESLGVSASCIFDLEAYDSELRTVYSLSWAKEYARQLSTPLSTLLGFSEQLDRKPASQLAAEIVQHCSAAGIGLDQFSDAYGWDVHGIVREPARADELLTFDALSDVCAQMRQIPERYLGGDDARA
jgi:hypothetical protein